MKDHNIGALVRSLLLELLVYSALLVLYFFLVLRYLGDFLENISINHSYLYAGLCLFLIVAQGVVLEAVTSFLLRMLRLDHSL
jgi:hypothetical protein